jgi:hypothetical protein
VLTYHREVDQATFSIAVRFLRARIGENYFPFQLSLLKGKQMDFQTGKLVPGLFYISLVPEAQQKLPRNNVELTKMIQYRRIRGPFATEQEAQQEEQKLLTENSKLETYVWQSQRQRSPAMV